MSKFADRFKSDKTAVEEGTWVDLGDDIHVKVRRLDSAASRMCRKKLEEPFKALLRMNQELPEDVAEDLFTKQFSQAIIVDWRGVTDEGGNAIAPNPDNIYKVLKEFPDFRDDILRIVMQRDTFKTLVREADVKN